MSSAHFVAIDRPVFNLAGPGGSMALPKHFRGLRMAICSLKMLYLKSPIISGFEASISHFYLEGEII